MSDRKPSIARQVDEAAYTALRRTARSLFQAERCGHVLEPTAVLHEALLRLAQQGVNLSDRKAIMKYSARVMRQVLVDHARAERAQKRGGDRVRVQLDNVREESVRNQSVVDLLMLDEALTALESEQEPAARVVELKFFAGMTVAEIGTQLELDERRVAALWAYARAFLRVALGET